jgi:PleD family two-component response regulator
VLDLDHLRQSIPDAQTCSAGVAEWDGQERPDQLFGRADKLLYEAKRRVEAGPGPARRRRPVARRR